jgi:hypothetical protein
MDFQEYFKKMCGDSPKAETTSFRINGSTTPFNKKELRWLKTQLETCIEWDDPQNKSKHMYKNMLKKVDERLNLL